MFYYDETTPGRAQQDHCLVLRRNRILQERGEETNNNTSNNLPSYRPTLYATIVAKPPVVVLVELVRPTFLYGDDVDDDVAASALVSKNKEWMPNKRKTTPPHNDTVFSLMLLANIRPPMHAADVHMA